MSLSPQFLDELKSRTSLSALIGKDVALKKAGREFRGLCPAHSEKSPSFYVNDEKAFGHCFGCSFHCDAISWLTDQKGLPFMDAVRQLAGECGMEVPASRPGDAERDAHHERLYEIMGRAASWFGALVGTDDNPIIEYLDGRGIDQPVRAAFGIGWAQKSRKGEKTGLERELSDVADETLAELGLRRANEDGEMYDFFRGRIMIPIHDQRGRVIAFGARALGDAQPKYLNSPDTPLFDKGRTLFNIHRAAPAARKSGRLVIVEGYMDVIALTRAGVTEAVAPNGTALTEAQLVIAWRFADEPFVMFDGDVAGRKAAIRAAQTALPMLEPGRSLRFVLLPEGKDPDDILREGGPEAVQSLLSSPLPLSDVIWESELALAPIDTPEQRAGFYTRLKQRCSVIRHQVVRGMYEADMLERFNVRFNRQQKGARMNHQSSARAGNIMTNARTVEACLVAGLIRYPETVSSEMDLLMSIDWQHQPIPEIIRLMLDAVIVTGNSFEVEFERAGMSDVVLEIQRAATLPFSFVKGSPTGQGDLVVALLKMHRK